MDRDYQDRQAKAVIAGARVNREFDRQCAANEIIAFDPHTALAELEEAHAGHPPSGHLAPIKPWHGDGKHAQRVAADLAARRERNEGRVADVLGSGC